MQKKKTLLSSKDVQTVGYTPFLSCVTCKVGCALPTIHQNVTDLDMMRGLSTDYVEEDRSGRILKKRKDGGCILLNDMVGCLIESSIRPIACLICPMQVDSELNIVVNVFCPDAQRIAKGVLEKDPDICRYVAASARLILQDAEFCKRSAEFVGKYKCRLVLGNAYDLRSLDSFLE